MKGRKQVMHEHLNILVVDDNDDLLNTFSLIFKRCGFCVETAGDGLTAVNMFRRGNFDITLMDIVLPVMNGVEAFQHIREINPRAQVILMTAYSDEDLVARAIQEGVHCVLHKPLRIDQIIDMIKEATSVSHILLVDDRLEDALCQHNL